MSRRRLIFRGGAPGVQPELATQPRARSARLLWLCEPSLLLVSRLRATTSVHDLAGLRERIADVLLDFRSRALAEGVEGPRVTQATEVLAALIDHVVMTMPWGADTGWQSLSTVALSVARRPAQRLLDLARAASSDADMQELIGVAVSLGFDRRGQASDDPHVDQLLALLAVPHQTAAPQGDRRLSPEGRSCVEPVRGASWLPLWVSSLVVVALLAGLYFLLQVSLGMKSDRVYARLAGMSVPQAATSHPLAPTPRLAAALREPSAARDVWVRDEIDRSVLVIPGSKLFSPGMAMLQPSSIELLRPIAGVLQATPGRIRIIGHTDGVAVRSARYPSDWELSVDRARVVHDELRTLGIEAARVSYDGRANIEPPSAAERAALSGSDGRIEIVLLVGR